MRTWLQEIRFGFRLMRKNPEVTLVAVLAMGLAIGATTTVFSVVDGFLLRPLAFEDSERLVAVYEVNPAAPEVWRTASPGNYVDWRDLSESFSMVAAGSNRSFTLSSLEIPETPLMRQVSHNYFDVLGVDPLLGRDFLPEEDRPGAAPVIILHHQLWQQHFGADPEILGKTTEIDGVATEIIGVMPPGHDNPVFGTQVPPMAWLPLALPETGAPRTGGRLLVIARLEDGIDRQRAQEEMENVSRRLAESYPETNENVVARVTSLKERLVRGIRPGLLLLLGAVFLVLLVACGNVANLLLARSMSRGREIALRRAMGARGSHLLRQLMVESLLLTFLGGALGLIMAVWGTQGLALMVPEGFNIPEAVFEVDRRVLAFTLAVSVLTGLLFGLLPARQAFDLNLESNLGMGASRSTDSRSNRRMRGALVVLEVAFSLVLMIGAGLMTRSFIQVQGIDPGCDPENVLIFRVSTRGAEYEDGLVREAFFQRLVDEYETLPGVVEAGAIEAVPFFTGFRETGVTVSSQEPPEPGREPRVLQRMVIPGVLETLHIPLLKGRHLERLDHADSANVVVISRTMAEQLWEGEDPIGDHVVVTDDGVPRQVVGIVGDVRSDSSPPVPQPILYVPMAQKPIPSTFGFIVRTEGEPLSFLNEIKRKTASVDPNMPVYVARDLEEQLEQLDWTPRFMMSLLGIFAFLALGLAATGIYAVLSYGVSQRTREIGIRMALGARQTSVLRLVLRNGLILTGLGTILGLIGAVGFSQLLASQLYGVETLDPATYVGLTLGLLAVALFASAKPALRATRVNPVDTLRQD